MTDIEIDVDGITAEVDEAEYAEAPERVVSEVLAARAEASDLSALYDEPGWDFNTLTEAFGNNDETEVE